MQYGDRNSTTTEKVSKFQHLLPNLQLVDTRKGIRYQNLALIPLKGSGDDLLRAVGRQNIKYSKTNNVLNTTALW